MSHGSSNYGDKFDGPVGYIMLAVIIAAFVGVIALQSAAHNDCRHSDYTYCEPTPAGH